MDILRLGAIAVIAALCALVLKKGTPELSLVLALGAGVLLLWESVSALGEVLTLAEDFAARTGLSSMLWAPVWKTAGIGVITRLGASLCRDAGESGIAAFLETAGGIAALCAAVPLIETVFDTLAGLL